MNLGIDGRGATVIKGHARKVAKGNVTARQLLPEVV